MPTFLDSSLDALNRGYQQLYGPAPVAVNPAGTPDMATIIPVSAVLQGAPVGVPTPVASNPEIGQPLGASRYPSMQPVQSVPVYQAPFAGSPTAGRTLPAYWNPQAVTYDATKDVNSPYYPHPVTATPVSNNPEVGQPLGAGSDSGGAGLLSGSSGFDLWGWLQNLFGGGQQQSPGQPASINVPQQNPLYQVGPATPTTPQAAQTTGGIVSTSPAIDQANAANTSLGGSGMSGGQMGSSIISGLGSGLSNMGKSIAAAQTTFTPPNTPLPQRAVFAPPNLSPNTKASY